MTLPTQAASDQWVSEMEAVVERLQGETVLLSLPALLLAGVALMVHRYAEPLWVSGLLAGLVVFFVALLLLYVRQRSFLWSSVLLVLCATFAVYALAQWAAIPELALLFLLPAGLATLTLGTLPGLLTGLVLGLFLAFAPAEALMVSERLRWAAGLGLWVTIGMIWLALRPLMLSIHWAWDGYEKSRAALEQARDFQARLATSMDDLTGLNIQLTRLNQLANGLRQVAEDERRAKEQFVANVSHELRTPLNMIIGFCEMIMRSPETYGRVPHALLADLGVVLRNSQHLASLIDDVLDMSQIDAGHMALTKEWTPVKEIVEAVSIAVRPLYESKDLYLRVAMPDDLPEIFCDRTRIREVLLNLLSNAGRFTDQGGVTVRLVQEDAAVLFSVTDTGKGIAPADQSKLFKPFQQGDGSIRRRYGGTGLGLSISKNFVELHHGSMWVESEAGKGSTFYFRLPLDDSAALGAGISRWFSPYLQYDEHRPRANPGIEPVRPRMVVVERGGVLQRLLSRYLRDVDLAAFSDLPAALRDLADTPASTVLVNDPRVGEVLHQLNGEHALPYNLPAIVCSIPGIDEASGALGVSDYLVKPISRDSLLGALERLDGPVRSVLLVDDDAEALQLYRRILASAGQDYRVRRAENGLQALAALAEEPADVILLDLTMPEMDGFQFLEARAEDPALAAIPVILISARDPKGQPIASSALAVTRGGGLSVHQIVDCVKVISAMLDPTGRLAGPTPPENPHD
jgi:signal transduction histidine kinase/CheY-like chemotaxis protein